MNGDFQNLTKKERKALKREEKLQDHERAKRKKSVKRLVFWLIVAAVAAGAVFGVVEVVSKSSENLAAGLLTSPIVADDWIKGTPNSKAVLVEYSDFQCPACASYNSVVKALSEEFGDRLAIVYRHFPLRSIHTNADNAARAAEAAGMQEKFWEMADIIFENQKEWSNSRDSKDIFAGYAMRLGLNIERFMDDFDSAAVQNSIDDDLASGLKANVNATPTFFLNGKKIQNPRGYEEFKSIIQTTLAQES